MARVAERCRENSTDGASQPAHPRASEAIATMGEARRVVTDSSTLSLFDELDATSYLASRSQEDRRGAGAVYTPPGLVAFVLSEAGYRAGAVLLDPACGCGAFLTAATDQIASALVAAGMPPSHSRGRRKLLDMVRGTLFGVDVDETACSIARATVRERVEALTGRRAPRGYFSKNVVEADFLLDNISKDVPPPDLIVGNPPYVPTTRLTAAEKDLLRSRFETAFGRIDLYALFIERSLALLPTGGILAFVTPDKYLAGKSMSNLRALMMRQAAVRRIARFRSHKIFEGAATVPCVTVLERGALSDRVRIAEVFQRDQRVRVTRRATVHAKRRLNPDGWNLLHPKFLALAQRIRGDHPRLLDRSQRISAGYATGRDRLYVLAPSETRKIEPDLLVPVARGRDIDAFSVESPALRLLLPYEFPEGAKARLLDIRDYPGARAYLETHRPSLEDRHCVRTWGKPWFDLHDPVTFDLTRAPKILVPDVANRNRFAFDPGTVCPLHSAYYIIPKPGEDCLYLTGLLNARPLEFLAQLSAPVVKDGFRRYRRQFLAQLPIPQAAATLRRAIAEAAHRSSIERVNELASRLFGLTEADERVMEGYLAEQASPHES